MADGKVVIETDLDSSGIEKGLSKLGSITAKGMKAATVAITGTAAALGGVAAAAIKVGSDFESQMSRVKAISGATGEEFEQLKAQAMQLGADTSFSASQAAEGMENLAAAGFTTSEIMNAMPGLLNLAAASGEDLASSSDIAASTLRGFGLAASDAAHVADVLAANANRTNSSVADTGEAMKYIAPLARAAGLSLEETAAAIGIMANAGVNGSQAGTSLRGALSRLSKPTKDMSEAMDELGISFYDSNGKMKSLTEQVGMLRQATEGMTDEQKNNYLVTLYGQEALSGMLALINEGEGSLGELTEAYRSCDGEAQKAAETMQDNLSGALEQLGGSAETLGLAFYNSVADNLKNAAKTATESINNITDSFNNGGLNEAIQTAGDEFANLAIEAASHAPEMVDTAVDFIESFASGIASNKGRILGAAGEMAESMASGLAELLPSKLQEPVEDAIDAVAESLSDGGLKEAAETAADTLDNVVDAVGNLADKALPPLTKALDFAGENLDLTAASATAAFTAFKGYKVVTSAGKAMKSLTATVKMLSAAEKANALQVLAASGALTAKETIIGICTGKIKLATAAQMAWNAVMAANPIGLVVTAVAALAAGIGVYALMQKDAEKATGKLTEKQKENIETSKEAIKSINEEAEARQKNLAVSTSEIDNSQALWEELTKIVDANGQVKAGYEARAKFITGELSNALGVEIDLVDGVITNYGELQSSIYDVIAAKKAEAVMGAMKSDYADAMQEQAEKAAALADAYEKLNAKKAEQAGIEADLAKEAENAKVVMTHTGDAVTVYSDKYYELKKQLKSTGGELKVLQADFDAANAAMKDNQKVISDYNMLADAIMSGSTERINSALASIQSGVDTTLKVGSDAAIKQASTTASTLVSILEGEKEGLYELQNETKQSLAESVGIAINQVGTGAEEIKQVLASAGKEGSAQIVAAMAEAKISGTLSEEARAGMESFISGFAGLDEKTQEVWAQAWYGALKGLEGFEQLADPAEKGAQAFLESLMTALEVHSPSRAVARIFENVWPGASSGLDTGKEELNEKGKSVVQSFLDSIGGEGLYQKFYDTGRNIMNFFGLGVGDQKENSRLQGKSNADAANEGAASVNPFSTGMSFASILKSGISSMMGALFGQGSDLANKANDGSRSVNPTSTGVQFGKQYSLGVKSQSGQSRAGGKELSNAADSGARSKSGRDAGSGFGEGFVSGISDWIGGAINAAANLAANALSAAKRALDEHSPSKKTRKFGQFFSKGLALGIKDEEKSVVKSSRNISNAALESIDLSAVSARMREVMAFNASRVANRPATSVMQYKMDNAEIRNLQQQNQAIMSAVAGLSDLAKRPIEVSTTLNGRELIKETAAPMLTEQQRITDFKKLLKGERT